uniref:GS domain-containing protein n=1 Tax=Globodera rostochiensis TaxID=31243 RepID=A0A914GV92_GLORO
MIRYLPVLLLLIVQLFECYSSDRIEEKKRQHKELETNIRRLFSTQKAFIPAVLRLRDDELLCKCNHFESCGKTMWPTSLANSTWTNNDGTIREVVTSCVHREQLLSRERPFVCQNITNPQLFQTVTCCKSASFCNDFEFPVELGLAEQAYGSDDDGWSPAPEHLYFLLLFLVSVFFSGLGLCVGIFYPQKVKALFDRLFGWVVSCRCQTLDRLRPRRRNETTASSNSHLDRLMEEATMSTGSGAGAPMLAERTMARRHGALFGSRIFDEHIQPRIVQRVPANGHLRVGTCDLEICRRMSVPTDSVPSFPYQVSYWEYVRREPSPDEMAQCVCVEGRRPSIPVDWSNSKADSVRADADH